MRDSITRAMTIGQVTKPPKTQGYSRNNFRCVKECEWIWPLIRVSWLEAIVFVSPLMSISSARQKSKWDNGSPFLTSLDQEIYFSWFLLMEIESFVEWRKLEIGRKNGAETKGFNTFGKRLQSNVSKALAVGNINIDSTVTTIRFVTKNFMVFEVRILWLFWRNNLS